jgi:AcrR family transcriptional regulator
MVRTPWGDSGTLRERMLRPGPGAEREEVRRSQRRRLLAAMVAVCAEKGYEATRVADLIELSGVSRKAFYEHFADKEACFLATLEEILEAVLAVTAAKLGTEGTWAQRALRAMQALTEFLVDQPAAGCLCMVEAYAAGPEAVARVDEALAGFQAMAMEHFEALPGQAGMPPEIVAAMIGGLRNIILTHLAQGKEAELPGLMPDLVVLGSSYRPPSVPLRASRRRRAHLLALSKAHPSADPAERLIRATIAVVADRGYAAATVAEIVKEAGTSLSTFYEHFENKEAAFEAALYSARAQMLGVVLPAYQRARSWPAGIRALTEAIFAYMEADPDFARLVAVDVHAAGPRMLERRDRAIASAQRFIDDGVESYAPDLKPIAREAIVSCLYAMLSDHVRTRGAKDLQALTPVATYLALSPFLGPELACEVANGGVAPVP